MWLRCHSCRSSKCLAQNLFPLFVPLSFDLPSLEMVNWNKLYLSWNGDYWHSALDSAPCPVELGWPLQEGGRGGGALWLISWPGRTTTLPLARAYGAACPMDSCNRSTCPCSICVHVKEHRLVIPYYLLILYNTLGSFRKVATGLTLLPDWKGTNACIKILFFLYC